MARRRVVVFLLFTLTAWIAPGASLPALASPLPPQARVQATAAIPGFNATYAAIYTLRGKHLAVITKQGSSKRRVWDRMVPANIARLAAPGPRGVFLAMTGKSGTPKEVFALRLAGSSVIPAVRDTADGHLTGDEGITVLKNSLIVQRKDTSHQGTVRYRVVVPYLWQSPVYRPGKAFRVPDYPANSYPKPNGVVKTRSGDLILMKLEIANTEQKRETGLMNRHSMDPDSGMVFVWSRPVKESFWMQNTYIPLSVAFISADGKIQDILDMEPLTTDLHTPLHDYLYAIEMNKGFFAKNGIQVGDRVTFHLNPAAT